MKKELKLGLVSGKTSSTNRYGIIIDAIFVPVIADVTISEFSFIQVNLNNE